jgi:hypothetical protein
MAPEVQIPAFSGERSAGGIKGIEAQHGYPGSLIRVEGLDQGQHICSVTFRLRPDRVYASLIRTAWLRRPERGKPGP